MFFPIPCACSVVLSIYQVELKFELSICKYSLFFIYLYLSYLFIFILFILFLFIKFFIPGTRTIADDLIDGVQVTPIHTAYEGFFDCARSTWQTEGLWGFYKGFGALVCQFMLHLAVLRLTRLVFDQLEDKFADKDPGVGQAVGAGQGVGVGGGVPPRDRFADLNPRF